MNIHENILFDIMCGDPKYNRWDPPVDAKNWACEAQIYLKQEEQACLAEMNDKNEAKLSDDEEQKVVEHIQKRQKIPEGALRQTHRSLYLTTSQSKNKKELGFSEGKQQTQLPIPRQLVYIMRKTQEESGVTRKVAGALVDALTENASRNYALLYSSTWNIAPAPSRMSRDEAHRMNLEKSIPHTREWEEQFLRTKMYPWERPCKCGDDCQAVLAGSTAPGVEYLEPDQYALAKAQKVLPPKIGRCLRCLRHFYQSVITTIVATGMDRSGQTVCPFFNSLEAGEYIIEQCSILGPRDMGICVGPVVAEIPGCYEHYVENGVTWFRQTGYVKPTSAPRCHPFFV